jgi:hypothetical protein
MDDLEKTYQQQYALYEEAIAAPTPDVAKVKQLNVQLSNTLHSMIEVLTNVRKETGGMKVYRDELLNRLHRIQKEYNGLAQNNDTLETLRRIRESEQTRVDSSLHLYIIGFFIAAILLIVVLFFKKDIVAAVYSEPSGYYPMPASQLYPKGPLA